MLTTGREDRRAKRLGSRTSTLHACSAPMLIAGLSWHISLLLQCLSDLQVRGLLAPVNTAVIAPMDYLRRVRY